MPIYEFQCQACGTEIEVLQKISDPHITDCEACGKPEMKKKVTAAAFRLSGAGWYETDFKEGDKKKNLTEASSDTSLDKRDNKSADGKTSSRESSGEGTGESANKSSDRSSDKSSDKQTETTAKKTETHASNKSETKTNDKT